MPITFAVYLPVVYRLRKGLVLLSICYLNIILFIPLPSNHNTGLQMEVDMPFCRTIMGQKSISFLGQKIWNNLDSNIKTAATTVSFTHRLKKETPGKLQE